MGIEYLELITYDGTVYSNLSTTNVITSIYEANQTVGLGANVTSILARNYQISSNDITALTSYTLLQFIALDGCTYESGKSFDDVVSNLQSYVVTIHLLNDTVTTTLPNLYEDVNFYLCSLTLSNCPLLTTISNVNTIPSLNNLTLSRLPCSATTLTLSETTSLQSNLFPNSPFPTYPIFTNANASATYLLMGDLLNTLLFGNLIGLTPQTYYETNNLINNGKYEVSDNKSLNILIPHTTTTTNTNISTDVPDISYNSGDPSFTNHAILNTYIIIEATGGEQAVLYPNTTVGVDNPFDGSLTVIQIPTYVYTEPTYTITTDTSIPSFASAINHLINGAVSDMSLTYDGNNFILHNSNIQDDYNVIWISNLMTMGYQDNSVTVSAGDTATSSSYTSSTISIVNADLKITNTITSASVTISAIQIFASMINLELQAISSNLSLSYNTTSERFILANSSTTDSYLLAWNNFIPMGFDYNSLLLNTSTTLQSSPLTSITTSLGTANLYVMDVTVAQLLKTITVAGRDAPYTMVEMTDLMQQTQEAMVVYQYPQFNVTIENCQQFQTIDVSGISGLPLSLTLDTNKALTDVVYNTNIVELFIHKCIQLASLPSSETFQLDSITGAPKSRQTDLTLLQRLILTELPSILTLYLQQYTSLQEITIDSMKCLNTLSVPPSFIATVNLNDCAMESLDLASCQSLSELILSNLRNLSVLDISDCSNLASLSLVNDINLRHLITSPHVSLNLAENVVYDSTTGVTGTILNGATALTSNDTLSISTVNNLLILAIVSNSTTDNLVLEFTDQSFVSTGTTTVTYTNRAMQYYFVTIPSATEHVTLTWTDAIRVYAVATTTSSINATYINIPTAIITAVHKASNGTETPLPIQPYDIQQLQLLTDINALTDGHYISLQFDNDGSDFQLNLSFIACNYTNIDFSPMDFSSLTLNNTPFIIVDPNSLPSVHTLQLINMPYIQTTSMDTQINVLDLNIVSSLQTLVLDTLIGLDLTQSLGLPSSLQNLTFQNMIVNLGSFNPGTITNLTIRDCVLLTSIDLSTYSHLTTFVCDTVISGSGGEDTTFAGFVLDDNGYLAVPDTLTSLSWSNMSFPNNQNPFLFFHVLQLYSLTVDTTSTCDFPNNDSLPRPLLDKLYLGSSVIPSSTTPNSQTSINRPDYATYFPNLTVLYANITHDNFTVSTPIVFPPLCKTITFNSYVRFYNYPNRQQINALSSLTLLESLTLINCNLPSSYINSITLPKIKTVVLNNAIYDYDGSHNATASTLNFAYWNPTGLIHLEIINNPTTLVVDNGSPPYYLPNLTTFIATSTKTISILPSCPNLVNLTLDISWDSTTYGFNSNPSFSFDTCIANSVSTLHVNFTDGLDIATSSSPSTLPSTGHHITNLSELIFDFTNHCDANEIDITSICTSFPYISRLSLLNWNGNSDLYDSPISVASLVYLDQLYFNGLPNLPNVVNGTSQFPTSLSLINCGLALSSTDLGNESDAYLFNFNDGVTTSDPLLLNWMNTLLSIDISNNSGIVEMLWDLRNGNVNISSTLLPLTLNVDNNPFATSSTFQLQYVSRLYVELVLCADTITTPVVYKNIIIDNNGQNSNVFTITDFVITNFSTAISTITTTYGRSLTFQQHATEQPSGGGTGGLGLYPFLPPNPNQISVATKTSTTTTTSVNYYPTSSSYGMDTNTTLSLVLSMLTYLNVTDAIEVEEINVSCSSASPTNVCICNLNTDTKNPITHLLGFNFTNPIFDFTTLGLPSNMIGELGLMTDQTITTLDCRYMDICSTLYLSDLSSLSNLRLPTTSNLTNVILDNLMTSLPPITMDTNASSGTNLSTCTATLFQISNCVLLVDTSPDEPLYNVDCPNIGFCVLLNCSYKNNIDQSIDELITLQFTGLSNYLQYLSVNTLVDLVFLNCTFPNFDYHFMLSGFALDGGNCLTHSLMFDTCSGLHSIYFKGMDDDAGSNPQPATNIVVKACSALSYLGINYMPSAVVIALTDYNSIDFHSQIQIALDTGAHLPALRQIDLSHNFNLTDPANNTQVNHLGILPFTTSPSVFCSYAQFLTYLSVLESGHFSHIPPPTCLLTPIQNSQLQVLGFFIPPPNPVVCFLRNTQILTPTGYLPIQTLKEQDNIKTHDGRIVPILKIKRFVVLNNWLEKEHCPCLIKKHTFGKGVPFEDLYVTSNHAIYHPRHHQFQYASSVGTIATNLKCDCFAYYHFSLPNYLTDFPVANGVITESWFNETTNAQCLSMLLNSSKKYKWNHVNHAMSTQQHLSTLDVLNGLTFFITQPKPQKPHSNATTTSMLQQKQATKHKYLLDKAAPPNLV